MSEQFGGETWECRRCGKSRFGGTSLYCLPCHEETRAYAREQANPPPKVQPDEPARTPTSRRDKNAVPKNQIPLDLER